MQSNKSVFPLADVDTVSASSYFKTQKKKSQISEVLDFENIVKKLSNMPST